MADEEVTGDEYDTDYFDTLESRISSLEKKQYALMAGLIITLGYSVMQAKLIRNVMGAISEIANQQNEIVGILNAGPRVEPVVSNEPVHAPNGYDPGPQTVPDEVRKAVEKDNPADLFNDNPPVA